MEQVTEEFYRELEMLRGTGFKDHRFRKQYEEEVHGLKALASRLRDEGLQEEEIARELHSRRRAIGKQYKDAAPPLLREYILWATGKKYGDPLGPSYENLRSRKTDAEIIESSSRPIPDLDDRLTVEGFVQWFREERK